MDFEDCIQTEDLVRFLERKGYTYVWLEDTDAGVVIHGVSMSKDEGGNDIIVPEEWNNR